MDEEYDVIVLGTGLKVYQLIRISLMQNNLSKSMKTIAILLLVTIIVS